MKEIEGVHIDNDILKNRVEDIEHLFEEVEDFMDPKSPLMAKAIKMDAAVRFSPKVQELMKMVMKDFGIKSVDDIEKAVERVVMHVVKDVRKCPYFRRLRKGVERMVRFAMKNVQVSDLPKGKRMRWVNVVTMRIYKMMKSDTPVEELHHMIGRTIEGFLHELERYGEQVEKIEQTYNKKGGL